MQKDVVISIVGKQDNGEDQDSIELTTTGQLYQKPEGFYICYEDSEATGFQGSRTVVKVEGNNRVTMTRRGGKMRTELVVEQGKRHLCRYDTEYGQLTIGVSGNQIDNRLDPEGGIVRFMYTLDVNTTFESKNEVTIEVKSAQLPQ